MVGGMKKLQKLIRIKLTLTLVNNNNSLHAFILSLYGNWPERLRLSTWAVGSVGNHFSIIPGTFSAVTDILLIENCYQLFIFTRNLTVTNGKM